MSIAQVFKKLYGIPEDDDVVFRKRTTDLENKRLKSSCIIESSSSLPLHTHVKADVSDLSLIRSIGFFTADFSGTSNTLRFTRMYGGTTLINENEAATIFDYAMKLKRVRIIVSGNTKNAVCNVSYRVNNADVPEASLTVNVGTNPVFDSGVLNVDIAVNSRLAWKIDNSASASGTIVISFYAAYEIALV